MEDVKTEVIKDLIQRKDWVNLKRMLLNLQKRGIPNMELVAVVNKIIHEAMKKGKEVIK